MGGWGLVLAVFYAVGFIVGRNLPAELQPFDYVAAVVPAVAAVAGHLYGMRKKGRRTGGTPPFVSRV